MKSEKVLDYASMISVEILNAESRTSPVHEDRDEKFSKNVASRRQEPFRFKHIDTIGL